MSRRLLALLLLLPAPLLAQDRPVDQGIRIGISYNPGVRPTLLVLMGAGDIERIRHEFTRRIQRYHAS